MASEQVKGHTPGRRSGKAQCPDCDGDGYIRYTRASSVNHMATVPASRPCQTCNLKAFGLTDEQVAEYLAEAAISRTGAA